MPSLGHVLSQEIIAKHGKDRYPTVELNFLKLMEELGELARELLGLTSGENLRKEYADVGLTLYALGDKLGLDLLQEMKAVVENEDRRFT